MNASRRPKPTPSASRRGAPADPAFSTRSLSLILAAVVALAVAYYLANHLAQRKVSPKVMPVAVQMDMVRGGTPVHSVSTQDAAARASSAAPLTRPPENDPLRPGNPEAPAGRDASPTLAQNVIESPEAASGADAKTSGAAGPGASAKAHTEAPAAAGAAIYRCRQGQSVVFSQWPCDAAAPADR